MRSGEERRQPFGMLGPCLPPSLQRVLESNYQHRYDGGDGRPYDYRHRIRHPRETSPDLAARWEPMPAKRSCAQTGSKRCGASGTATSVSGRKAVGVAGMRVERTALSQLVAAIG